MLKSLVCINCTIGRSNKQKKNLTKVRRRISKLEEKHHNSHHIKKAINLIKNIIDIKR